MAENNTPLFFLVAGESSGDYLGSRLMQALKVETGRKVRFVGVGGPRMQAEGIDLLFPQSDLAHMGLFELIIHLPRIVRRIYQTIASVKKLKPDAVITIDSPDFCFRVAKKVKGLGIPLIHYVAPTVWAWRPKRAKKIAAFLDHLLVLLPFEPPYFTKEGLACTFVGHPLVESGADHGDAAAFRKRIEAPEGARFLALLPGSRSGEVKKLLPIFRSAVCRLAKRYPNLHLVVPTVPAVASKVEKELKNWSIPVHVIRNDKEKYDAFAACDAALACSGTVSVELAMASVPTIIAYKVSVLTVMLYRRFIKAKYATLLNIMKDREVMPEYLQEECMPEKLAEAVERLLDDATVCQAQKDELDEIGAWLGRGQFIPSEKAASTVLKIVRGEKVGA